MFHSEYVNFGDSWQIFDHNQFILIEINILMH